MLFFSIIIPTYNRAHLISKTIQSVLDQTYKYFEIIVVDDGSTDNTEEVIGLMNDRRIKYFKKENEERSIARNYGMEKANGDFIYLLDSDDIIYRNHLQLAYDFINKNKTVEIFFFPYEIINTNTGKTRKIPTIKGSLNEYLAHGNILSCHGVFFIKKIAKTYRFRPDMYQGEDYEFWLRVSSKYEILYTNTITSALIEHPSRGVLKINKDDLINQKFKLINYALKNEDVQKKYGHLMDLIISNAYTYIALHLAISKKHRKDSIKFLLKGLHQNPRSLFKKRTLAIIKHIIV